MRNIDEELRKQNSVDIKKQNPELEKIAKQEQFWIDDFNNNFETIFKDNLLPIVLELSKTPNIDKIKTRTITIDGKEYVIPINILQDFHKSYIGNIDLRQYYEEQLKTWFIDTKDRILAQVKNRENYQEIIEKRVELFSLASLAISSFHKRDHMILRKAQKRTALVLSEGNIAELASGEGKTLAGVLSVFMQSLTQKGVHVMTANNYLSKRDYEELLPIYEGLGVSVGYVPSDLIEYSSSRGINIFAKSEEEQNKLLDEYIEAKQDAYRKDITFSAINNFAFDYLRDNAISDPKKMIQREYSAEFSLVDEVDDALINSAKVPYIISNPIPFYIEGMSLKLLCREIHLKYEELKDKVNVKDPMHLSYEEARYITVTYSSYDLIESPEKIQEKAEEFYHKVKIYYTNDNDGIQKTSIDTFYAIANDRWSDYENIIRSKENYGIVYCKELNQFKVYLDVYDDFLEYCYLTMQINSQAIKYKDRIISDNSYVENTDYYLNNDILMFTERGATRIIKDPNYPEFAKDYENFMLRTSCYSSTYIHYFNQAIIANLLLEKGRDYIVDEDEVKLLSNGRVMPDSSYSNGLHQAVEIKEKIKSSKRTRDTSSTASITQLNYFSRYGLVSGMTGTADEKIFGNVYKKKTVRIPRAVVEEKKPEELLGVDIKKREYSLTLEDKINLIIASVEESHTLQDGRLTRKQPVLIVVANPSELNKISEELHKRNYEHRVLDATKSKEDEAIIIANAGAPGAITLSTEMAGRGTDIILGGDRELAIDIGCAKVCKKYNITSKEVKDNIRIQMEENLSKDGYRSKEEELQFRKELETIGLKVIISGVFREKRSESQVIGRTGRNGVSGVCEQYICPDDLRSVGISSLETGIHPGDPIEESLKNCERKPNGRLILDEKKYAEIENAIDTVQQRHELELQKSITNAQQLSSHSAKLVEEYRDQRRKILYEQLDNDQILDDMITGVTDAIISSYISEKDAESKDFLTKPINEENLEIDIETLSLEIKQILGVTFDPNIVLKSRMNILEFRDAIIRTAKIRKNTILNKDNEKEILLRQNEFMITAVQEMLERSITRRNITYLTGQTDVYSNIEFANSRKKLLLESYRRALKPFIGLELSMEEFMKIQESHQKEYELVKIPYKDGSGDDYLLPALEENNVGVVDRIRAIKEKMDKEDLQELQAIDYQIRKSKNKPIDLEKLYDGSLNVRPWILINKMVDGNVVTELKLVRLDLTKVDEVLKEKQPNKVLRFPLYMSKEEQVTA